MDKKIIANKVIVIREDLNVPIIGGKVANDARIRAILPTIKQALDANCGIVLLSHLGRPKEFVNINDDMDSKLSDSNLNSLGFSEFSLKPIANHLRTLLPAVNISFSRSYLKGLEVRKGEIVVCENVRFNVGEKDNDKLLSQHLARLGEIVVMDAFAASHRAHASTTGIVNEAKYSIAGPLLENELDALNKGFSNPKPPIVAIVGGAKVSTKLTVLKSLLNKVDVLIAGGGIANTFLKAMGVNVGSSLYEPELVGVANDLLESAKINGKKILLPIDVVIASELSQDSIVKVKQLDDISDEDKIFDIGPETLNFYKNEILNANTIIWNGPVGVFEYDKFANGTKVVSEYIAESKAFSLAGGGDTISAIEKFGIKDKISYISTGGGAFLEYLEGKELPAIKALKLGNG